LKSSRGAVQNRFRLACGTQPADVPVVKNAVLKLACLAVRKGGRQVAQRLRNTVLKSDRLAVRN